MDEQNLEMFEVGEGIFGMDLISFEIKARLELRMKWRWWILWEGFRGEDLQPPKIAS